MFNIVIILVLYELFDKNQLISSLRVNTSRFELDKSIADYWGCPFILEAGKLSS